jgi:DNA-directed RNA polymerase specialized sigma24 family protein
VSDTFDAERFAQLWRMQEGRLSHRVRRFGVRRDDVDDLLAETRLRMLKAGHNPYTAYALLVSADATARRIVLDRRAAVRRRRKVQDEKAGRFSGLRPRHHMDGDPADYLDLIDTRAAVRDVLASSAADELGRNGRRAVALLMRGPKFTPAEHWVLRQAQKHPGWDRLRDVLSTLLAGAFVLWRQVRRARGAASQPAVAVVAATALTIAATSGLVPLPASGLPEARVTEASRLRGWPDYERTAGGNAAPDAPGRDAPAVRPHAATWGSQQTPSSPLTAAARADLPTATSAGQVSVRVEQDDTSGNGQTDAGLIVRCDNSEVRRPICTAADDARAALPTAP